MGTIQDSLTHAPLKNVSVRIKNNSGGTNTDAEGRFRITVDGKAKDILFSYTGYHASVVAIGDSPVQRVNVLLAVAYTELGDVFIQAKRGKYRNKNNPAVDLIRQVIAHKSKNAPGSYPYWSFQQYEKIRILFDTLPPLLINNLILKKFKFIFQNTDTTVIPGKPLIPVYIEEVYSKDYDRTHPKKEKKIILASKNVDFGKYLDMHGVSIALNRMYENFNIYDNTISVFTIQFKSPIADLGPDYYMYFIQDTVVENGEKLVQLYFIPRNPEDLLFQGTLYITLDGNYAIRKFQLEVSKHIDLNWVRYFRVKQNFDKGPGDHYHLANSDMIAFFSPLPKSPGIFGERTVSVSQVSDTVIPDAAFKGPPVDTLAQAFLQTDSQWEQERSVPLSAAEHRTYANTDSLLKMRPYNRLADYINLLASGYKSAGKFDIGPVGNFYSYNPVEGQRLLFGGRSNTNLSSRYFIETYAAYGFKDMRWKYYINGTYSINHRSIYAYPFNYIQVSLLKDTRNPGVGGVFNQGNNFLSEFNRGNNTQLLYNDIFRISYIHEFGNHFSYDFGIKYWQQQPAGSIIYQYVPVAGQFDTVREITTTDLSVTLRWAPGEQFYQGMTSRSDITNKYPIITFQFAKGVKGLWGGQYDYESYYLNLYKRVYVAPFGFADVTLNAGLMEGNLPFPLLIIPFANQSYFYTEDAYNLMNYEEFVSDHYAGINIDQFFGGFFFNRIPLFKRLRLREVIAAKVLYGGIRNDNNPDINPAQMKFPMTNGVTSTYTLGNVPYVEASIGIYNIFSIFRIDLVRRFTYLNHPGASGLGLRVSSNFNF